MNAPSGRLRFDDAEPLAEAFDADVAPLILDFDGWEGPLHVLLELARAQKVDLMALSITRLADQFLAFVRQAKASQFTLAADYLVMAAWLALLKSRLLLPRPVAEAEPGPPAEEVARQLAERLARLDAIRRASAALEARPRLGRDVFQRGDPRAVKVVSMRRIEGDLHALLTAYTGARRRDPEVRYTPPPPRAWRLDDARDYLGGILPALQTWTALTEVAPTTNEATASRASLIASTFSAALEFARERRLQLAQSAPLAALYLRAEAA